MEEKEEKKEKCLSSHQDETDGADFQCGIGYCRLTAFQKFANAAGFTGFFILPVLASQTLGSYINSQIPTLEKQFGLTSYESGVIMTFNDIGFLVVGLLASSIPRLVHIPRWLCGGILVFGVSGLLCSLPHFIIQSEQKKVIIANSFGVNETVGMSDKHRFPLCVEQDLSNLNGTDTMDRKSSVLSISVGPSLKSLSVGLIAIGMILQGAAKSFRAPFLTEYIDRENKKRTGFYIGITVGFSIFGPALAYGIGGLFSNIYVTLEDIDMSTKDPRWIGAWWLGFLVFGILALVVAFPVACFPRYLAKKDDPTEENAKDEKKEMMSNNNEKWKTRDQKFTSRLKTLKERSMSYIRVMKSPVYVCMVFAFVLHISSILGPTAFKSKYIAAQFGIPLWKANVLISGLLLVTVSVGAFLGGLITRKFKMSPRVLVGVVLILHSGQIFFHGGLILVGCNQPAIIGPNSQMVMTNSSDNCHCDSSDYLPVCGSDGRNYHSPCYAGCTDVIRSGRIYVNCTKIPDGEAAAGLCSFDCNMLIPYLVLNVLGAACGSLKIMPMFMSTIRSVEDRDKSTAAGLKSILASLLAFIPAPIIFGRVIDATCIIWNTNSKRKGACSLYNIEGLRYGMFGTVLVYKSAAVFLLLIALYKVWNIKDWPELQKKKLTQNGTIMKELNTHKDENNKV